LLLFKCNYDRGRSTSWTNYIVAVVCGIVSATTKKQEEESPGSFEASNEIYTKYLFICAITEQFPEVYLKKHVEKKLWTQKEKHEVA
jgi:hypothetical protein